MTEKERNALGVFVAEQLERLGMTRSDFAEMTGLGRTTVYELIGDNKLPGKFSTEQLRKMSDVLGVTVDVIVDMANGTVTEVAVHDELGALVRGFVLANHDLTPEQLREALKIAEAAARMARPFNPNGSSRRRTG